MSDYNVEQRIEEYLSALRREGLELFVLCDLEDMREAKEWIMDLLIDLGVMRELDEHKYGVQQSLF